MGLRISLRLKALAAYGLHTKQPALSGGPVQWQRIHQGSHTALIIEGHVYLLHPPDWTVWLRTFLVEATRRANWSNFFFFSCIAVLVRDIVGQQLE